MSREFDAHWLMESVAVQMRRTALAAVDLSFWATKSRNRLISGEVGGSGGPPTYERNMQMKYRASFHDPDDLTLDRPVQLFGNSWVELEQWRDAKLTAGGPNCWVEIYETIEQLREFKRKPKEQADAGK